jgi:hypothetical protein
MSEKLGELKRAALLERIIRELSPFGQQTAAMEFLAYGARAAEAAPDPIDGASLIDSIAEAAKEFYPVRRRDQ